METTEELQEHAEHARAPFDKRVAATMAIIAAALAVVSVLGHIFITEELLFQQKASDKWAWYQGKSIRRYQSETTRDIFRSMGAANAAQVQQYEKNAEKYKKESEDLNKEASDLENESHLSGRQALRLHIGEIFLEMAIVLASLAILTKRPLVYWFAVASGLAGVVIASSEILIK